MANGLSFAFSRIVRSLQRQKRRSSSVSSTVLLATACITPKTSTLPSAFYRHVRSLSEQVNSLTSRHADVTETKKLFDRVALILLDQNSFQDKADTKKLSKVVSTVRNNTAGVFKSASLRSVSLEVATETLLQLWESVLHYVEAFSDTDDVNVSTDEMERFEQSAIHLLRLVIQRHEFDVFLMTIANGGCQVHSPKSVRSTRSSDDSSGPPEADRSFPPRTSLLTFNRQGQRSSFFKREKECNGAIPSCLLVRKFLELHQNTIRYVYELTADEMCSLRSSVYREESLALVATTLSTSYVRVPFLRDAMLTQFQNIVSPQMPADLDPESNEQTLYEQLNMPLFLWDLGLHSRCRSCIAPFDREEFWMEEEQVLENLMLKPEIQMLFCGELVSHLSGNTWGRIEWQCIPGFSVLRKFVKSIVEQSFSNELCLPDASESDGQDEDASQNECVNSTGSGKGRKINSCLGPFFQKMAKMLGDDPGSIHELLMAVLTRTNYLVPHHVSLCLGYLEKMIAEFPEYFISEPNSTRPSDQPCTSVPPNLLQHVFSCLLESEHFEILKSTELFLLKHFAKFSVAAQAALVDVMASQFHRLFLHWHRDVRFCYFHMVIYLTYPGNRLTLCAKSDEMIMGPEASHLFEIPGLVQCPNAASWTKFDEPICALLSAHKQWTKAADTSLSFTVSPTYLDRSILEYQRHVRTYFQCAKLLSIHDRVPTPVFSVKGATAF